MTKTNNTKRALLSSVLALMMCIAMLIGSTFAWFTDNVSSVGNKIQSGTLKIDLELLDKESGTWNSIKEDNAALFNWDKWEPGYVDAKVLKIENEGTLALKWLAKFVSEKQLSILANVIDVYVCLSETELSYPTDRNLDGYTKVGTVADFVNDIEETTYGNLEAGKSAYLGIALKMQESAGNDYQGLDLGGAFDIMIVATQDTVEEDSFDNQYDKDATYPLVATSTKIADVPLMLSARGFNVVVPASAPEGTYTMNITNVVKNENEESHTLSFHFEIKQNPDSPTADGSVETLYDVSVEVGSFLNISSVESDQATVSDVNYNNKEVTFKTNGSGVFEVIYTNAGEDIKVNDNGEVVSGVFKNVNPANFDSSLSEVDSEYIAINYEKDGETYYVVAERATTLIVAADDAAGYTAVNGNYTVTTNQSGKLWSLISGLQNKEFSTVYLLPGTYNEGTTINVYSSMDIIGLGDKDSVKVIKGSSSDSNRHLFNCNGTKADYINVTLCNLYLDATANTTGGKDNAAVQSIRKTKVKCYDLTIVKNPTNFASIAFYINGNNAVGGVKYPAYLYVENCSLNTTKTFCVATTSGTYKFYHSGLTYNGTVYTQNSGSILNKTMEPNDWEW